MYRAQAMFLDSGKMFLCAIALMLFKTILRISFCQPNHQAIALNFGDNGSESDDWNFFNAFDNCFLILKNLWRAQTAI